MPPPGPYQEEQDSKRTVAGTSGQSRTSLYEYCHGNGYSTNDEQTGSDGA